MYRTFEKRDLSYVKRTLYKTFSFFFFSFEERGLSYVNSLFTRLLRRRKKHLHAAAAGQ